MTVVATVFGATRGADAAALTNGYSAGLLGAAAIAVVGAVLSAVWLRSPNSDQTGATVDSAPVAAG